jgi:hypothetical protein
MSINAFFKVLIVLFFVSFSSCDNGKTVDYYIIGKDSCNLTDENGKRQGKWVPNYNNDLKDTLYYKDGEIISK